MFKANAMAPYTGEQGSIPVLAYLASPTPLSLSCSMYILHAKSSASIVLNIPLLLDGSDAEQTFVAQYDPDNIRSVVDEEGTAGRHIIQDRLSLSSSLHTLSLTLKHPCLLWYPHQGPPAAKPGCEAAFRELCHLAQATSVHVVFDTAQLRHPRLREMLSLFVSEPQNTTPFQAEKRFQARGLCRGSWLAIAPTNDAPPAYAESSDKRRRPGKISIKCHPQWLTVQVLGSSSPPSSPQHHRKKPRGHPPEELTSDTEIASDNSYLDHQDDLKEDNPRHLPRTPKLPAPTPDANTSPPLYSPLQELSKAQRLEIASAVERLLPQALDKIFPNLEFSVASNSANQAAANTSSNLHQVEAYILPYLIQRIRQDPRLPSIEAYLDAAHDAETRNRDRADLSFDDKFEDYRQEMQVLLDEKLADLEREGGYALDKLRSTATDLEDTVSKALQTSDTVDRDAETAALDAKTLVAQAARKAIAKVHTESAQSVTNALHVNQYARTQIRDAEKQVDRMIKLKMRAWRRRVFHFGTRKSRRGRLPYKAPKCKGKNKSKKLVPEQAIESPSETREDEPQCPSHDDEDDEDDGTATVVQELPSNHERDGDDNASTTDEEL